MSVGGVGSIGTAVDGSLWLGWWPVFSSITSFDPSALVLVALALGGTCCCGLTFEGCDAVVGCFTGCADSLEPGSVVSSEPPQQLRKERKPPRFFGLGSEPACARPAEPGLVCFSPSPATCRFDRLLPVLASLRRLRFELVSTLSVVSFAVAPLSPATELSCPGTPSICPALSSLRLGPDCAPAETGWSGDVFDAWACDCVGSPICRLVSHCSWSRIPQGVIQLGRTGSCATRWTCIPDSRPPVAGGGTCELIWQLLTRTERRINQSQTRAQRYVVTGDQGRRQDTPAMTVGGRGWVQRV